MATSYYKKMLEEYYEYAKDYFVNVYQDDYFDINSEDDFIKKIPIYLFDIFFFSDNEHLIVFFKDHPEYKTMGLIFKLPDKNSYPVQPNKDPVAVYNNFLFESIYDISDRELDILYEEFDEHLFPKPKKERMDHITEKDKQYKKDAYKISKKIADNKGVTTDDIDREIARLYTINPKPIAAIIKEYGLTGYKNYILEKCKNLFYHEPDTEVFIAIDDDKTIWCYSEEEWEKNERGKYNPYNLKNTRRAIGASPISDNSVILSPEAYNSLKFWTELTYTMGKIYYNVSEEIAQEFAKTLQKDNYNMLLYRGMTFEHEEDHVKFLSKNKCSEKKRDKCEIEFKTFTSWSYDYSVALNFARKFKRGIVVMGLFSHNQLLVDITKVDDSIFKDRLRYKSEREVVALPFKGTVTVVDYDPTDNVDHSSRRRASEDEDSFEVTEFSEDDGSYVSPPPGFE
jgi:hypothetical protein